MLFKNEDASLKLEVVCYEFPADGGVPGSDDRNWLVLRATWRDDGDITKDSNSCLLTYELKEMTAGLKVLNAGIRDAYESGFVEPYFALSTPTCWLKRWRSPAPMSIWSTPAGTAPASG